MTLKHLDSRVCTLPPKRVLRPILEMDRAFYPIVSSSSSSVATKVAAADVRTCRHDWPHEQGGEAIYARHAHAHRYSVITKTGLAPGYQKQR